MAQSSQDRSGGDDVVNVLLLCTANVCRSPMAEVLLTAALQRRGAIARVASAGFRSGGLPAAAHARTVVLERGFDLEGHRSRRVTPEMLAAADLVLTMERAHVASAAVLEPTCWPVCFALDEAVARAEEAGPRAPRQSWPAWIASWHPGRRPSHVLDRLSGDLPDPMGGSLRRFRATADTLEARFETLLSLALPGSDPSGARETASLPLGGRSAWLDLAAWRRRSGAADRRS